MYWCCFVGSLNRAAILYLYLISLTPVEIPYCRETLISRFWRLTKFREIIVPQKKGAQKIKDAKFSGLDKNLHPNVFRGRQPYPLKIHLKT